MSGVISDGTGSSYKAKVNQRFELQTQSRSVDHAALKCVTGDVFLLTTPWYGVDTTGGRMIWALFSDPVNYFVIDKLIVNWNGGNTNHNRGLQVEFILGDTTPTTGTIPYGLGNTNSLSTNTLDATVLAWDGVTGSGMTGHTPGQAAGRMMATQGYTTTEVGGKMIVGPGTTLAVNAKAEEDGIASIGGYFYLFDPAVDG